MLEAATNKNDWDVKLAEAEMNKSKFLLETGFKPVEVTDPTLKVKTNQLNNIFKQIAGRSPERDDESAQLLALLEKRLEK